MSPEELFFDLQSIGAGNRAVALTVLFSCHQKFVLGEFVPAVLKAFLDDIEDQRDSLEKGELTRDNALLVARDCEDTLVEKKFLRAVESDGPEFINLTEKIEQEERGHLEKLSDYIKSISMN